MRVARVSLRAGDIAVMGEDRVRVLGPAAPGWVSCALLDGPHAGKPAMWTTSDTAVLEGWQGLTRSARMAITLAAMLLWWELRLLWYRCRR